MQETPYVFESWYTPFDTVEDLRVYSYESLLELALGERQVVFFLTDTDYQGDWVAFVTDGSRVGLVEGSFGSCSGCDALEACGSNDDVKELAEDYLKSVRTFPSWESVRVYLEDLEREGSWAFRGFRKDLISFAEVELPYGALDVYVCLKSDAGSGTPEIARMAKVVHAS